MKDIYRRVLNEVCLDDRISKGTFEISNPDHITVLREYMVNMGIPESIAIQETNKLLEKGQHPERQAYNKNGILVTFPSAEHKQKAVSGGTHFEKDPTKAPPNVTFDQGQAASAPADAAPAPPTTGQAPAEPTPQPEPTPAPAAAPTPQPAPAPAPSAPPAPEKIDTPQEKAATAAVIKQILRSDDTVLEETSKYLEGYMPISLANLFRK